MHKSLYAWFCHLQNGNNHLLHGVIVKHTSTVKFSTICYVSNNSRRIDKTFTYVSQTCIWAKLLMEILPCSPHGLTSEDTKHRLHQRIWRKVQNFLHAGKPDEQHAHFPPHTEGGEKKKKGGGEESHSKKLRNVFNSTDNQWTGITPWAKIYLK